MGMILDLKRRKIEELDDSLLDKLKDKERKKAVIDQELKEALDSKEQELHALQLKLNNHKEELIEKENQVKQLTEDIAKMERDFVDKRRYFAAKLQHELQALEGEEALNIGKQEQDSSDSFEHQLPSQQFNDSLTRQDQDSISRSSYKQEQLLKELRQLDAEINSYRRDVADLQELQLQKLDLADKLILRQLQRRSGNSNDITQSEEIESALDSGNIGQNTSTSRYNTESDGVKSNKNNSPHSPKQTSSPFSKIETYSSRSLDTTHAIVSFKELQQVLKV